MNRDLFYIESDGCLACCIPEREAPTLIGFRRGHCCFKKQPETPEETEQAIRALDASCIDSIRYAGKDPAVLQRLRDLGREAQCDCLSREGERDS